MGTLMTQFVTPEPATMPLSSTSNTGKRPHFASGFIIRVSQRTRWKRNIAGAGDHRCVVANSVFKSYPPKTRNCFPVQIPASGRIMKRGAGALVERSSHMAVWTGSEMIVWGGGTSKGECLNSGARYDPSADRWTPLRSEERR